MSRQINRLNARSVATTTRLGRHSDGGGLYLSISANGGRRWVFLYRWRGKPVELGLGSTRDVGLARARELAAQNRAMLAEGANPKDARKPVETATFGDCADRVIDPRCIRVHDSFNGETINLRTPLEMGIDADERSGPKPVARVQRLDLRSDILCTNLGERTRKALVVAEERTVELKYVHNFFPSLT
jgi:hypothetical protein